MSGRQHDEALITRAQQWMPGGVNSPVRAFKAVGGVPVFVDHADGAYLFDTKNTPYVDYVGSWGPMLLGHAHPAVIGAIQETVIRGTSFGAPTEREIRFAEAIHNLYPSMEMIRATSSGTEATMSAARAARGFTGRDIIVKMEGCYHGHADLFLVKAGSGLATFGSPDSHGVPSGAVKDTQVIPFNDIGALEAVFTQFPKQIAAVILEPVVGNMGTIPPKNAYLETLRTLCTEHNTVLIFDEVMTGCRVALGGAQARYNIRPDLTVLGKIVGGGMPLAVYGGRREIMQTIAPLGKVYQAGTLSGNPVAVAAGLATINELSRLSDGLYDKLEQYGLALETGLLTLAKEAGIAACVQRVGSMFTLFFTEKTALHTWDDVKSCDTARFGRFHASMLSQGIYLPPSQFEAAFFSIRHGDNELNQTLEAAKLAFRT